MHLSDYLEQRCIYYCSKKLISWIFCVQPGSGSSNKIDSLRPSRTHLTSNCLNKSSVTSETQTSPVGSPRSGRRGHHHHHHRHHHNSISAGRGDEDGNGQRGRRGSQGSGSWYSRTTHSQVRHMLMWVCKGKVSVHNITAYWVKGVYLCPFLTLTLDRGEWMYGNILMG